MAKSLSERFTSAWRAFVRELASLVGLWPPDAAMFVFVVSFMLTWTTGFSQGNWESLWLSSLLAATLIVVMRTAVIAGNAFKKYNSSSADIHSGTVDVPEQENVEAGGPAYWTLTEAASWIAFGEAVQTKDWHGLIQKIRATPAEERVRIDVVERLLIDRLRDPAAGIDIQGKEAGDIVHKPIPHNVFLSKVGLNIFDSRIGLPLRADLQTMLDWKGPNWTDVLVRQAHVRANWRGDIGQQTVPLLDAAKQAYGRTRGTLVAAAAEARIGNEDRKPGTINVDLLRPCRPHRDLWLPPASGLQPGENKMGAIQAALLVQDGGRSPYIEGALGR